MALNMPNKENINKVIARIRNDMVCYCTNAQANQPAICHFRMGDWGQIIDGERYHGLREGYQECNTACCIGGWANTIRMMEQKDPKLETEGYWDGVDDSYAAMVWLGLTEMQANALFLMMTMPPQGDGAILHVLSLSDFDKYSAEQRYAAAITVLENLRDAGIVDWDAALSLAGISDRCNAFRDWRNQ